MTNQQRLQMEVQGIDLTADEIQMYLAENGLDHRSEYNAASNLNKKAIYAAALSILESLANNPTLMKNYKQDDMTISAFAENIQSRIDQLERKIRSMSNDDHNDTSFFNLFRGV